LCFSETEDFGEGYFSDEADEDEAKEDRVGPSASMLRIVARARSVTHLCLDFPAITGHNDPEEVSEILRKALRCIRNFLILKRFTITMVQNHWFAKNIDRFQDWNIEKVVDQLNSRFGFRGESTWEVPDTEYGRVKKCVWQADHGKFLVFKKVEETE